jgi:very-short-patch-repair endonuclease
MKRCQSPFVTRSQYVDPEKLELAREFRKKPTLGERTLWKVLKTDAFRGLHFRRQQIIGGFIVDFYCADARVAIELDGSVHGGQAEEDRDRDRALSAIGIRTIRIASDRTRDDLPALLEEIFVACSRT